MDRVLFSLHGLNDSHSAAQEVTARSLLRAQGKPYTL